jgi:hypothetical protein
MAIGIGFTILMKLKIAQAFSVYSVVSVYSVAARRFAAHFWDTECRETTEYTEKDSERIPVAKEYRQRYHSIAGFTDNPGTLTDLSH